VLRPSVRSLRSRCTAVSRSLSPVELPNAPTSIGARAASGCARQIPAASARHTTAAARASRVIKRRRTRVVLAPERGTSAEILASDPPYDAGARPPIAGPLDDGCQSRIHIRSRRPQCGALLTLVRQTRMPCIVCAHGV
jgi:hypothetical protein